MFTVIALNHSESCRFERSYLDKSFAITMFNTATKCEDCAFVDLIDATTGEVLLSWEAFTGITYMA